MRLFAGLMAGMAVMLAVVWAANGPAPPALPTAAERAARRAYDGAPPVIPHPPLGSRCSSCHRGTAVVVPGIGIAPPMPHGRTAAPGRFTNCRQCHVFRAVGDRFASSGFSGFRRATLRGDRLFPGAPPTIPHPTFLREDCRACHDGRAAREEVRCSHPERLRCIQCHVPAVATGSFPP